MKEYIFSHLTYRAQSLSNYFWGFNTRFYFWIYPFAKTTHKVRQRGTLVILFQKYFKLDKCPLHVLQQHSLLFGRDGNKGQQNKELKILKECLGNLSCMKIWFQILPHHVQTYLAWIFLFCLFQMYVFFHFMHVAYNNIFKLYNNIQFLIDVAVTYMNNMRLMHKVDCHGCVDCNTINKYIEL